MIHRIASFIFDVVTNRDGGLGRTSNWRCLYPEGRLTRRMPYMQARNCKKIWGGKVIWSPQNDAIQADSRIYG